MKMYLQHVGCILLLALSLCVCPGYSEVEYYPGLRRPPNWSQTPQAAAEEASDLLAQIIEERARQRFQQQLAQQHYYQHHHQQRGPNSQNHHHHHYQKQQQQPSEDNVASSSVNSPSFTYSFSDKLNNNNNNENNYYPGGQSSLNLSDDIQFAVNPSDPRYYEKTISSPSSSLSSSSSLNDANKFNANENDHHYRQQQFMGNVVSYSRLKPPMEVNPKMPSALNNFPNHHDINDLVDKLERQSQIKTFINNNGSNMMGENQSFHQRAEVTKKHMGIDGEMGMYLVALIAGLSAAVTVGLIALGIGWYTLQKRTKAAADVEYPAYGVTGPNKDISPSGDRRLAQSAQMYHYQHQKQQIIAMENRVAGDNNGGMSDVESDDDNDEGDYTVYECPGLAPTGEMEVKNPLFVDDTPVTPLTNLADGQSQTQQQPQQAPQQEQQQQQQQQDSVNQTKSSSTKSSSKKPSKSGSMSTQTKKQQSTDDRNKKQQGENKK